MCLTYRIINVFYHVSTSTWLNTYMLLFFLLVNGSIKVNRKKSDVIWIVLHLQLSSFCYMQCFRIISNEKNSIGTFRTSSLFLRRSTLLFSQLFHWSLYCGRRETPSWWLISQWPSSDVFHLIRPRDLSMISCRGSLQAINSFVHCWRWCSEPKDVRQSLRWSASRASLQSNWDDHEPNQLWYHRQSRSSWSL